MAFLNFEYLRTFVEVVKRGSFSEAGRVLGLSQPTVSFQVQRLEEAAAAQLLERRGGGVSLTDAGREFQIFAERVLAEHEALLGRLAPLQRDVVGRLTIGASTIPGEYLLPGLLGEFCKQYPSILASIISADSAEVVDLVLERQCDYGVVGAEIKKRGLQMTPIAQDELMIIFPPHHPLAQRPSVKPEELRGLDMIQREEGSGTRRSIEALFREAGFNLALCHNVLQVGSSQGLITAVEAGVGGAFVSRLAAEKSLTLGRVKSIPVEGVSMKRAIYFIYPEKQTQTPLLAVFKTFVGDYARSHFPRP